MRLIDADDYRECLCEQLHMPLERARLEISTDYEKGLYDAARLLNTQPTVTPEPHWIPVTERLPECGKDVLVTRDYDGREDHIKSCRYVEVASCYGEDDDVSWNSYSDEYKMTPKNHRVVAWMPLPEPYRGVTT